MSYTNWAFWMFLLISMISVRWVFFRWICSCACLVLVVVNWFCCRRAVFCIRKKWLWAFKVVWSVLGLRFTLSGYRDALAAVYLPEALGSGYNLLASFNGLGDLVYYSLFCWLFVKNRINGHLLLNWGFPGGTIGPNFYYWGVGAGNSIALIFDSEFADVAFVPHCLDGGNVACFVFKPH